MLFKIAMKQIARHPSGALITAVFSVLGTMIIAFSAIIGAGMEHAYNGVDKLLKQGVRGTAVIRTSDLSQTFINDLKKQPEILGIGSYTESYVYDIPELMRIKNKALGDDGSELSDISVSNNVLELFDIKLQSGAFVTELPEYTDLPWDGAPGYLYLGSGFSEIPVGTELKNGNTVMTVAGIFEEGQALLDDKIDLGFDQNHSDYTQSSEWCVVALYPFAFTGDLWLSAADGYTIDQAIDKAFQAAERAGIKLQYTTLQKSFDHSAANAKAMESIYSGLSAIVCVSCAVMILCSLLSEVYGSLEGFGIMYAQGFSQRDAAAITLIKNAVIFLLSAAAAIPLVCKLVDLWFYANENGEVSANTLREITVYTALPAALGSILLTAVLGGVISVMLLKKFTPVEMIGGQYDQT